MMSIQDNLSPNEADTRLLEALASLNQISGTINHIGSDDVISSADSLQLIVKSAISFVPGSSAVIYTYDEASNRFEIDSRVSAEPETLDILPPAGLKDDLPRQNGIGARAVHCRRRVISYEEPDLDVHPYRAALGVRAVGCFPLIVVEQVVGVLYVYLHEERNFSRLELLILDNFVNQAAMAIYHTRRLANMRRDLDRKEDELNRLHRAGMLISSRLKLEETLEFILQMALEMTNAQYGIFRLLDHDGENLITRAFAGVDRAHSNIEIIPLSVPSVMGTVARSRQPILIPDLLAEPWLNIYYPLDDELKMRSELAVPLINASGRLEGVLNLESPVVGAFDENHSHILQSLATYAVTAIQEVRLLDALLEVARLIFSQPCQRVLDHLVALACDLLNASASAIWLRRDQDMVLESSCGGDRRRGERVPLTESLTGQAVLKREAVVANDIRTDPRFHHRNLALSRNWERALVVPLLTIDEEQPMGAFGVYSSESDPGRFAESDWDKKVLTFLAHYAVLALQAENRQQALRSAQEQRSVAETFAAVGDIASNLLHQLNNKVGTIPVRIQGIQDKCRQTLNQDAYLAANLEEIERSANEAMTAVRENLSHLRPIQLSEVDIAGCIKKALETANLPDEVEVELTHLDSLPPVIAGQYNLVLVFANLFENASDAMNGIGKIIVNGAAQNRVLEITVSDTGPGIPPELHAQIFKLNYSSRGQTRPGKLGFGLWWVKTVMARLGGSVTVESDGMQGTTFRLKLPVKGEK